MKAPDPRDERFLPLSPRITDHLKDEQPRLIGDGPHDAEFQAFHRANPHIFEALRAKALEAKQNGLRTFGMKALVEDIRWDPKVRTSGKPWKLNNNHTAAYARLLMEETPELRGFFRLRD